MFLVGFVNTYPKTWRILGFPGIPSILGIPDLVSATRQVPGQDRHPAGKPDQEYQEYQEF